MGSSLFGAAFLLPVMLAHSAMALRVGNFYSECQTATDTTIHDFTSRDINDTVDLTLREVASGKLTMVVNVATFCGLTQQYNQMNALFNTINPRDFTIIAFPCNQFGHQEPGKNASEILNGLKWVRPGNGFIPDPNIHMMMKGDVNGDKQMPVYGYLKESCRVPPYASRFRNGESFWKTLHVNDISWNFEKFLISPSGVPLFRLHPWVEPFEMEDLIHNLMRPVDNLPDQQLEVTGLLETLDATVSARVQAKQGNQTSSAEYESDPKGSAGNRPTHQTLSEQTGRNSGSWSYGEGYAFLLLVAIATACYR